MIKQEETLTSTKELKVILNWFEDLKRLAPPGKK
jgi:hypothetical protein